MWLGRLRSALGELDRECERAADEEERANFELARSARAFTQRARARAEDKLAFSAVLMRAGEAGAAERLIHDLELDVRAEEAEFSDRVERVKVAAAGRRAKMTRLRLARMVAVAILTAGLLSFSAAGVAVTAFVADLGNERGEISSRSGSSAARSEERSAGADEELRSIRLPDGTKVELSRGELRAVRDLAANPQLSRAELERLLVELVGRRMAGRLVNALAAATRETRLTGDIEAGAEGVTSRVGELGSPEAHADVPSSAATSPKRTEPVKHSEEPSGNPAGGGIIDAPLGVEPKLPGSLGGD